MKKGFAHIEFLVVVAVLVILAGVVWAWQNRNSTIANLPSPAPAQTKISPTVTSAITQTKPSPTIPQPSPTPDPTTNWKLYRFSPTINLKLPSTVKDPLYVNAGHYAVEAMLPAGTVLQIWGADGASPSGSSPNFNELNNEIANDKTFTTLSLVISGLKSIKFSTTNRQSTMIWGGETYYKITGYLINTKTGGLVVAHYSPTTGRQWNAPDYLNDEKVFDQILSTFRFD